MRQIITSAHNQRIKDAIRLRDRRGRDRQGRIVIDGLRELRRAHDAGVRWIELFVCEPLCTADQAAELIEQLEQQGATILSVPPDLFQRVAFGARCEGLVGVADTPVRVLNDLVLPADPLIAVLEGVEKPGNIGAILRSADGAGLDAVVLADGGTDLYNPNSIRASLGTIFCMPVCVASTQHTLAWLRQRQFHIYVARVGGGRDYSHFEYAGPTAIVLGAEAAGLSTAWCDDDMQPVELPMLGAGDSLNVSTAAAVLFYEARRQRGIAD